MAGRQVREWKFIRQWVIISDLNGTETKGELLQLARLNKQEFYADIVRKAKELKHSNDVKRYSDQRFADTQRTFRRLRKRKPYRFRKDGSPV